MNAPLLALFAFLALIFILWTTRGRFHRAPGLERWQHLHKTDRAAFRNLLSRDDDDFLRASLTASHYRQVRRVRLRAAQEYLVSMAEDCGLLIAAVRSQANISSDIRDALTRRALRVRLMSVGLWLLLWVEWSFPQLHISPIRMLRAYEEFRRILEASLQESNKEAASHNFA